MAKDGPYSLGSRYSRVCTDLVGARHLRLVRMAFLHDRSPNALLSGVGALHGCSWFWSGCHLVDGYRLVDLNIQKLNGVGLVHTGRSVCAYEVITARDNIPKIISSRIRSSFAQEAKQPRLICTSGMDKSCTPFPPQA